MSQFLRVGQVQCMYHSEPGLQIQRCPGWSHPQQKFSQNAIIMSSSCIFSCWWHKSHGAPWYMSGWISFLFEKFQTWVENQYEKNLPGKITCMCVCVYSYIDIHIYVNFASALLKNLSRSWEIRGRDRKTVDSAECVLFCFFLLCCFCSSSVFLFLLSSGVWCAICFLCSGVSYVWWWCLLCFVRLVCVVSGLSLRWVDP